MCRSMKSAVFAFLLLPGLSFAFPENWVGIWNGSQVTGTSYVNAVLEFTGEKRGIFAFEFLSNASTFVYSFQAENVADRDGYYEIFLTNALEGDTENLEFKLLLMPESGIEKISAVVIMLGRDRTFFFPSTIVLTKPGNDESSLKLYEKLIPYKEPSNAGE